MCVHLEFQDCRLGANLLRGQSDTPFLPRLSPRLSKLAERRGLEGGSAACLAESLWLSGRELRFNTFSGREG